jgi:hypothetical protein
MCCCMPCTFVKMRCLCLENVRVFFVRCLSSRWQIFMSKSREKTCFSLDREVCDKHGKCWCRWFSNRITDKEHLLELPPFFTSVISLSWWSETRHFRNQKADPESDIQSRGSDIPSVTMKVINLGELLNSCLMHDLVYYTKRGDHNHRQEWRNRQSNLTYRKELKLHVFSWDSREF